MNRFLLREVVYPVYRTLKRDRVLAHLAEMRSVQWMDPDEILAFQWGKLSRLVDHAATHVPYYRRLFKELGLAPEDLKDWADFKALPILRKHDVRANKADMISEKHGRRDLIAGSTSGSTGESLGFYYDKACHEAQRANTVRMDEWIGIRFGDRVAKIWTVPLKRTRARRLREDLRNYLSNSLVLSHYRLDEETLHSYARRLAAFGPDLVIAYPSVLTLFSEFLTGHGLEPLSPKAVTVSAETLYDWQRDTIENALQTTVYNHYGSMEFIGLARECRLRQGLHIASERVLIEDVPVEGLSPGESVTELVVTDLDNYGMPFIRYAMEDTGSIVRDKCECGLGLPRLEAAIGRTFDIVQAPNGNLLGGSFWTVLSRQAKGIERFQVIQEEPDELVFAVVVTQEFSDESKRFITERVREACGPEMRVRFDIRSSLEPTPAGKHRFVISRIGLRGESGRD